MDIPQQIFCMTKAKEWLEKVDKKDNDFEYQLILNHIIEYLKANCQHNVIQDFIDISPEQSISIRYCDRCDLCFE